MSVEKVKVQIEEVEKMIEDLKMYLQTHEMSGEQMNELDEMLEKYVITLEDIRSRMEKKGKIK